MVFRIFTILAVLALILSTWILSSPSRDTANTSIKHEDSAGYYLKNAVMTDYDERGDPSLKLGAERIDQVGHTNEVTLIDVRVDYAAPNGQDWVMFGDTAHVEPGGRIVDLQGNVRLQGTDPTYAGTAVIRTDKLSYDVPEGIASTKSDVLIDFRRHSLSARGLIANLQQRTLRLESRVNGRFQP